MTNLPSGKRTNRPSGASTEATLVDRLRGSPESISLVATIGGSRRRPHSVYADQHRAGGPGAHRRSSAHGGASRKSAIGDWQSAGKSWFGSLSRTWVCRGCRSWPSRVLSAVRIHAGQHKRPDLRVSCAGRSVHGRRAQYGCPRRCSRTRSVSARVFRGIKQIATRLILQ